MTDKTMVVLLIRKVLSAEIDSPFRVVGHAAFRRSRTIGRNSRNAFGGGDVGQRQPVRETLAADIPPAIDHFRYFAGCIRAPEGTLGELDETTASYQFHEPLGVVGQIIPWNFPILMAAWKVAPALPATRSA
jgi:hypothetical protein